MKILSSEQWTILQYNLQKKEDIALLMIVIENPQREKFTSVNRNQKDVVDQKNSDFD